MQCRLHNSVVLYLIKSSFCSLAFFHSLVLVELMVRGKKKVTTLVEQNKKGREVGKVRASRALPRSSRHETQLVPLCWRNSPPPPPPPVLSFDDVVVSLVPFASDPLVFFFFFALSRSVCCCFYPFFSHPPI